MDGRFRLERGGRLDRRRPLGFTFDDKRFTGFAGDTLASALIANGVHLVGRSFKYHRPRGFLAAGVDEPNGLVTVNRGGGRSDTNLQATTVELFEGLAAQSQNRWPALGFDLGAANRLISPLIPAGFYYKTFMWPAFAWKHAYEPVIRRMAGLGRVPSEPDPDTYASRFDHCEVLVVGAGPAGIAAALGASEGPGRVILCDEGSELGGGLLSEPRAEIEGGAAWDWLKQATEVLRSRRNVTVLPRTTAFQYGARNMIGLLERVTDHLDSAPPGLARQCYRQVRAREVVLATGAHERPIVFRNNDLPGVMLSSAARTYLNRYAACPGRRAVAVTGDDSGYLTALDLAAAGVETVVLDLRRDIPAELAAMARERGVEVHGAVRPVRARGGLRVSGLDVVRSDGQAAAFDCDLVLMAGGWAPAVHLFSQSRGKLVWNDILNAYTPGEAAQAVHCAGAVTGARGAQQSITDGFAAGAAAAGLSRAAAPSDPIAERRTCPGWTPESFGASMAFVDFQNDVTAKDVKLALGEGFRSVEHLKRYTTTGMATDQGRTSNLNALTVAAETLGVGPSQFGITTYRPPYTPVTFAAVAGEDRGETLDPVRKTPMHDWAKASGAIFEDVGLWKRARYFPRSGETMEAAVRRECRTVRSSAGIFDASTLGKIEVVGADAGEFLHRMYATPFAKLAPGRCRYGLLLREDGFIYDDGVVARVAEDRFHVTTTTGGAAGALHLMEDYLQTEWPELKVWLTSTTEQWAVIAVQGPNARAILEPLTEGIDLAPDAFPHMSTRDGRVAGVPARVFRVSFTGELGFEVNVPSGFGSQVWDAIWRRAVGLGACAYGTETMHVLRAEKGYIIVGQETDGSVTPDDAGLSWAVGRSKHDFVGKRSLSRADMLLQDRAQLVGLSPVGHDEVPEEGAQLVPAGRLSKWSSQGHVTSAYWSEALGGPFALALLSAGRSRLGDTVQVTRRGGGATRWLIKEPAFYDPEGVRLHG